MFFCSCFPHIVNLACKAALAAITNLSYAADTVEGYEDYEPTHYTHRDCIATIRSLVNTVGVFDFLHVIVIYNNVGRFATVISRNSVFQNMFKSILSKITNFFMMLQQGGLQHC